MYFIRKSFYCQKDLKNLITLDKKDGLNSMGKKFTARKFAWYYTLKVQLRCKRALKLGSLDGNMRGKMREGFSPL